MKVNIVSRNPSGSKNYKSMVIFLAVQLFVIGVIFYTVSRLDGMIPWNNTSPEAHTRSSNPWTGRKQFPILLIVKSWVTDTFIQFFQSETDGDMKFKMDVLNLSNFTNSSQVDSYLKIMDEYQRITKLKKSLSLQIYSDCPETPPNLKGPVKFHLDLPENFEDDQEFLKSYHFYLEKNSNQSSNSSNLQIYKDKNKQLWPPVMPKIQGHYLEYLGGYKSQFYNSSHFTPKNFPSEIPCRSPFPESRVAIIICYRERELQLRYFLSHMLPIFIAQQLEFKIYIIEQASEKDGEKKSLFNRAKLFNIGYDLAKNDPTMTFDCYTFHDVDLLLLNDKMLYRCANNHQPRHLIVSLDKFDNKLPYEGLFGGGVQLTEQVFEKVNGYSNQYFGWGGEDDDLSLRLFDIHNFELTRLYKEDATYTMIKHKIEKSNKRNPKRYWLLRKVHKRWEKDGLNSLKYEINGRENFGIFEKITVTL